MDGKVDQNIFLNSVGLAEWRLNIKKHAKKAARSRWFIYFSFGVSVFWFFRFLLAGSISSVLLAMLVAIVLVVQAYGVTSQYRRLAKAIDTKTLRDITSDPPEVLSKLLKNLWQIMDLAQT